MSTWVQEERRLAVDTPLGKDVLLLTSFSGLEEMSRLFRYDLELRSTKDSIKAKDIVGKNITFKVDMPKGSWRHFNGVVRRFALCGKDDRHSVYRAEVVPWLWFLTRTTDCRIFQNKTVPEVIEKIFQDLGFSDFDKSGIKGAHPKWEYCVQYRETDFNFVSRLMEQEGIYYFFEHKDGKHTLILADDKNAYKTSQDSQVTYGEGPRDEAGAYDVITGWEHHYEFRSGKWMYTDYNFETPSSDLKTDTQTSLELDAAKKYEFYDYPGEYEIKGDGSAEVKLRMEEEEVGYDTVQGSSVCRSFSPGYKFELTKHPISSEAGKKYVITSIRHSANVTETYTGGTSGGAYYENTFSCIPDKVVFRPARITPKPKIHGAQTAVVVGPKGEEIYPDKYGRVKVQFFWDREGKKDEKSSCWIRCAQSIAGKKWGGMFIPRIGQEVVVTYLEGDPDRPLITGLVYNGEQMPAYDLPDEKTKSYIKTNSSKGGDGFNELRFEDKADEEQIFLHAERNLDVRVKKDSKLIVLENQHAIIGNEEDKSRVGDQKLLVFRDQHEHVKRHRIEHVGGNLQLLVGKEDASGGNAEIVIEKNRSELVGGNAHLHINGSCNQKVDGKQSFQAASHHEKIQNDWAIEAQSIHIKAGMNLVIEAGMQLSLKVGGNFVDISPIGVAINGTMVLINSGGMAGVGLGSMPMDPQDPPDANPEDPEEADDAKTGSKSAP